MRHLILALFLGSTVTSLTATAQESAVEKPQKAPGAEAQAKLAENPNDTASMNAYMIANLRAIVPILTTEPDKVAEELAKMQKFLDTLEPTEPAATSLLSRAKRTVTAYGAQVELVKTPLKDIEKQLVDDPTNAELIGKFANKVNMEAAPLARSEPEKAEKLVAGAEEVLEKILEKAEKSEQTNIRRVISQFGRIKQTIEQAKTLLALVGTDASELGEIDAWVNGEEITDEDLEGKVVLLDFWAVWCGPCIATFPHLREWNEKYAEKGLVMIGLTRYYNYSWDDDKGRAARSKEEVTPEDENTMLAKFAEHYKLGHRFAVQSSGDLSKHYAVTGIPHVVLIDRAGKVQLVKVGAGPGTADEIGEKLRELIGE